MQTHLLHYLSGCRGARFGGTVGTCVLPHYQTVLVDDGKIEESSDNPN